MQGKLYQLKGETFGDLTVLRRSYPWEAPPRFLEQYRKRRVGRQARWLCLCKCGALRIVIGQHLRDPARSYKCKGITSEERENERGCTPSR